MSLQRTRCFLLSLTLTASGYATSTLTMTENPAEASLSTLASVKSDIGGQSAISQIGLDETQLLDVFRVDSSAEPNLESSAAALAIDVVARAWPPDETPAVNIAPDAAVKQNSAAVRRQGLRMSMPPLK